MIALPFPSRVLRLALILPILVAFGPGLAPPAQAQLHVEITRGVVEPTPIAVSPFYGAGGAEQQMGQKIATVVAADLERSGYFRLINPASFIQDAASLQGLPRFTDWRALRAQGLVTGKVTYEGGQLRAEFRLWDVVLEQQMAGLVFSASPESWRRVAHKIADAVFKRITGEDGYFDTHVVYVAESGPATRRVKRLAIMDQDGENTKYLTSGEDLVLTPRFSPTSQEIAYLSYYGRSPRVSLFNIETGRYDVVGDFPGMTFAPRFSPDGSRLVMSLSTGSSSNIYRLDLRSRQKTPLTNDIGIDTSPSYSPDGSRIVFESDRGGTQQLYLMSADGGGVRRLTATGGARYGGPVWSPKGDLIAFTRLSGGRFGIGVMRPDGTGEKILFESYHAEGPTWAPNGRVLMFFQETPSADRRGRVARLYTINLVGGGARRVPTPGDASDPAWSPLLP